MTDAACTWGGDLSLGPSGDLATVAGIAESQERVTRRLFTNQGGYIWQLGYGGGFPALVGATVAAEQIGAIARAQMQLEPSVQQSPAPVVTTAANATGDVTVSIVYATSEGTATVTGPVG